MSDVLMIPILPLMLWAILVVTGAAIWFGKFRSWAHWTIGNGYTALVLPWGAVGCTIGMISILLIPVFPTMYLEQLVQVGGVAFVFFTGLGFLCAFTSYPRWAIPRWFRDEILAPKEDKIQSPRHTE